MRLRLIRHATLELDYGGRRLLVDPMLDPAEARGPVANTPNDRRNPLVELPEPAEDVAARAEIVLVTHLHADHLDDTAVALLKGDRPVLCQPEDAETLRERGFTDARPVEDALEVDGMQRRPHRRAARHRRDRGDARAGLRLRPARRRESRPSTSPATRSGATRSAPRSTSTRPTSWSSTRAARASPRATRSS